MFGRTIFELDIVVFVCTSKPKLDDYNYGFATKLECGCVALMRRLLVQADESRTIKSPYRSRLLLRGSFSLLRKLLLQAYVRLVVEYAINPQDH